MLDKISKLRSEFVDERDFVRPAQGYDVGYSLRRHNTI